MTFISFDVTEIVKSTTVNIPKEFSHITISTEQTDYIRNYFQNPST